MKAFLHDAERIPLADQSVDLVFPERLAEFFIRSFCPPGGRVFDPFAGSFTTSKVAAECGRIGIGADIRPNQIELGRRRLAQVQAPLF